MYTRLLTNLERQQIRKYLKQDGAREHAIRMLVNRTKSYMPAIKSDLALLEALMQTYSKG